MKPYRAEEKTKDSKIITNLFSAIYACFSGLITGLLGAGGGLITIYTFKKLARKHDGSLTEKDILANALSVSIAIAFMSLVSYLLKYKADQLSLDMVFRYAPSAIIGGITGAFILDKLNVNLTRLIFSLIVIFSGLWLLLK